MISLPNSPGTPPPMRPGRTVLVVDIVEFVRLMEQDEADTVMRVQELFGGINSQLLPRHGGRLVKSLGDGIMAEFGTVPAAMDCALDMHRAAEVRNEGLPESRAMWLRAAAAYGDVYDTGHDIQGKAVNLAARLLTLASPGGTVVSPDVRDRLVSGLDAEAEDLGNCYLKHLSAPVRAYRVSQRTERSARPLGPPHSGLALRAAVAVMPLAPRFPDPVHAALGDLLADQITAGLSHSENLQVISRLSCAALAGRAMGLAEIGAALGANYVASGSFEVEGDRVKVRVELARTHDQSALWIDQLESRIDDVLHGRDGIVPRAVAAISDLIIQAELARSEGVPLPNLQSHSLLMASIGLIHRSSLQDFERAREILEHLAQRHPRLPHAHAWMGKWHAMKLVQGLSSDPDAEAGRALDTAHRALDNDPRSSLALTMKGLVQGFMFKDLRAADDCYRSALEANPNEALAWLYTGTLRGWQGRGEEAWTAAQKALSLSPLDPMRYYFESLAGFAALAAGRFADAEELAGHSLRANRLHTATHRTLVIAKWQRGDEQGARVVMSDMLLREPMFSCARYRDRFPGGDGDQSREYARILLAAGAPP